VQQDPEPLGLERALSILRQRLLLIVLCVVVVAGAAYAVSKRQTKKYTASASLVFNSNPLSRQIAGLPVSTNGSELQTLEASRLELVKGGDVAGRTATLIGHGLSERGLLESLSIASQGESGVIDVSATTTSPKLAAEIANVYTQQFVTEQQGGNQQYYKAALAIVHKQLAALSPKERVGAGGVELQDRAQTLTLLSELKEGSATVAAEARTPSSPSSPKTSKNVGVGVVAGLLIGLVLVFVLDRFDRRIRKPEDLARVYDRPLLGSIAKSNALSHDSGKRRATQVALPAADAEAFSLIRARLRFLNVNRDLRKLVIASAEPGAGKTTIARHLAEAAARLGSRVLLVEADLRHPTLAQQLNVESRMGLADVLIGTLSMSDAVHTIDLDPAPGEGVKGRTLEVLLAGSVPPPNPGELLENQSMEYLLQRIASIYDFVVIDTPPLTAVSDAFPLLSNVDGIVIVGRLGQSRRDAAERLQQVLASSNAPLLGVIANGAQSGDPAIHAYVKDVKRSPATVSSDRVSSSEEMASPATR
jgi:succinoglycan biosynthesis transport protein ExoP